MVLNLTCCTKCVSNCDFPHASEKLSETSNGHGHPDHDVRSCDAPSLGIVKGENESGGSESKYASMDRDNVSELSKKAKACGPTLVQGSQIFWEKSVVAQWRP